jgi:hypothetical protein
VGFPYAEELYRKKTDIEKDYKCTITIYDKSVEYETVGLPVSIFRNPDDMPQPTAGDVLVISAAKVQSYRGSMSLITNRKTTIHVYSASDIPKPPQSAEGALHSSYGTGKLGEKEHEYVSWLYHYTSKEYIPDVATFQKHIEESGHQKDKFCKLENVIEGKFCDVIVNVVKAPYDQMDKTTLWVSDYTEHDSFYKFTWDGANHAEGRDSDLNSNNQAASKWPGPFGKRSMQVTFFEPHASQVNSEVELDQWIHIRNLRIKFGNNGINLEGILHEDRDYSRREVDILKWEGKDDCDPRLKEAIRRKKEYEKLKKNQLKSFKANEKGGTAGTKRKADDSEEPRMNAKLRRKEKREADRRNGEKQVKEAEERLGLNDLSRYPSHSICHHY